MLVTEATDDDLLGLADPVAAVHRLLLDGRVPPRVHQEDGAGGAEVQPDPAGLEREQEDLRALRFARLAAKVSQRRRPASLRGRAV